MDAKTCKEIESYFQSDNEHWNKYMLAFYKDVLDKKIFTEHLQALEVFDEAINLLHDLPDSPIKAIEDLRKVLVEASLSPLQRFFMVGWVHRYLRDTEFTDRDLSVVVFLLQSEVRLIESELKALRPAKLRTMDLRSKLKTIVNSELDALPELMEGLEPVQRALMVAKLMPYVMPKVQAVMSSYGEGMENHYLEIP